MQSSNEPDGAALRAPRPHFTAQILYSVRLTTAGHDDDDDVPTPPKSDQIREALSRVDALLSQKPTTNDTARTRSTETFSTQLNQDRVTPEYLAQQRRSPAQAYEEGAPCQRAESVARATFASPSPSATDAEGRRVTADHAMLSAYAAWRARELARKARDEAERAHFRRQP